MIATLLSFLGGSAFRAIWGEVADWFQKRQEHAQELERMKLQEDIDGKRHNHDMERIRLQAELGVKQITVQADAEMGKIEADTWSQLAIGTTKQTGVAWVDAWNGAIRPLIATMALVAMGVEIWHHHGVLTSWDMEVFGAALGIFVADRSLAHRGK